MTFPDIFTALLAETQRRMNVSLPIETLHNTPNRAAAAWREWMGGYLADIPSMFKTFEQANFETDQLICVHGLPVHSMCEHHLAPIRGTATVAYLPGACIVGLSKMARVVDAFSRRLQVQEQLTTQIADAVAQYLQPRAVGVIIRASHGCMSSRGVRVHNSVTTTSAMRGLLKTDAGLKQELLTLYAISERNNDGT